MRYKVLGPIEAERDGAAVGIGGPQQRRLLGMLLAQCDHVVSNDRLVGVLWSGDDAPDGAARSMMTYVSRLRAALGDGTILTSPAGYRLDRSSSTCDADEFTALVAAAERSLPDVAVERYEAALALWRGEPFGELGAEWWAVAESTRLRELRIVAREERAAALLALGHPHRAIPDLEALAIELPLRERPVSLLMQSLHASGRQVEALRRYRAFRKHVVEATGLDPSPELAALERSIAGGADRVGDAAGRPLRGYVIHDVIGEGAFGRIYTATQPGTERLVAIKAIRPDLADTADFVRRFEAEAQLVARLEHPHIVPLYDYWREPGGAYLVLRLLGGGTARAAVVAGGPWSLARVSRLVEEIGGALIVAHAAGVVHHDVKSSNVLLDIDGGAYLTDFGIAVMNTTGDSSGAADVRDDVRSLGWLLWELLTGSTPLASGAPPSLVGRLDGVPDGLDAVLARTTAIAGGYASIAELVLAWRAAVGRSEGAITPVASDERLAVDSARRQAALRLAQSAAAGVNPYKGLRAFDEADVAAYFGRAGVVDELATMANVHRMITVVGASGSGKSSAVRAGLVPRLRTNGCTVASIVPGDDPSAALFDALTEVATESLPSDDLLGALRVVADGMGRLVVVVDQFEECWTRVDAAQRDRFVDVVAEVIDATDVDVRFVTTIRADLLDRPLQHPRLGYHVGAGTFVLAPMSPTELDDAIVLPAATAGVHFDEGIVAQLVADASTQPGALPLLQFTLAELYDRRVDGRIGNESLVALGGMTGAVGRRAESMFESLEPTAQADARDLFSRLVVPGDRAPDTRRRARLSELSPGSQAVAHAFVDARLLVTDRDQATREPTVEVAHEALLTRWDRLAGWIADDRRWLAQLNHLAVAARAWDEGGRLAGELYRGSRLEAAIEAVEGGGRAVSALEREFVEAGRVARDVDMVAARRSARRLGGLLVGVAVALVLALIAGTVAVIQQRRADDSAAEAVASADAAILSAREASIEALVGRAESMRSTQRDTAALLAVEAFRLSNTARTRSALLSTFTNEVGFLDTHRIDMEYGPTGLVMPDGETALIAHADGHLYPYDLETGELGTPWPMPGDRADGYPAIAASPDGRLVAQLPWADDEGTAFTVGIFDASTAELTTGPELVAGRVGGAAFSPDGGRLVATVEEERIILIDTATGRKLTEVPAVAVPDDAEPIHLTPSPAVLANGDIIVGSDIGRIRVLDGETLAELDTFDAVPYTSARLQTLSDDSVVGSGIHGVVRFNASSGRVLWEHRDYAQTCMNMRVIEEAGAVFCGSQYGALVMRDLATGVVVGALDAQNGGGGPLWPARDGTELVNFGNNEPVVARWRLDGSGPITRVGPAGWGAWWLSPSGERMIVASTDRQGIEQIDLDFDYKVVDVASGDDLTVIPVVRSVSWIDNDTLLGTVEEGEDLRVVHLDLTTGDLIADGVLITQTIDGVNAEPGAARIYVELRDGENGSTVSLRPLSPDGQWTEPTIHVDDYAWMGGVGSGRRVAIGTSVGVRVYDGATGEQVGLIPGSVLRGAYITPADQLFVTTLGGELTQYDLDTLEPIRTFGGAPGFIQELYGTADGSTIVVRGGDRSVTLYDVATGVRLGSPISTPADDDISAVTMSADGSVLALSGGIENGYQVWDLDPEHWVEAACRIAGRNLTRQEWSTNIGDLAEYTTTCPEFSITGGG